MRNFGAQLLKNAQEKAKNPAARPALQRAHVKPVPPPLEHVIEVSSDTDVTKSEAGSISSVRMYSRKKVVTTLRHVLSACSKPVLRRELQLVGVSALLFACKYEEIWAPEVNDFILISDNAYMREQILKMEKVILNRLEWNLTMPMLYVFLVRFAKAASSSSDHKSDKEYGLVQSKPSTVAAATVHAARLTLKMTTLWTDTLRHHNGFSEAQLMDATKILIGGHGMKLRFFG
ncbi:Cyclin-B1-1 [Hordeum vulgare]|nr:Cyclin-B1-1 [Hordeum vulgare]